MVVGFVDLKVVVGERVVAVGKEVVGEELVVAVVIGKKVMVLVKMFIVFAVVGEEVVKVVMEEEVVVAVKVVLIGKVGIVVVVAR